MHIEMLLELLHNEFIVMLDHSISDLSELLLSFIVRDNYDNFLFGIDYCSQLISIFVYTS
jgi:hypothetical protein